MSTTKDLTKIEHGDEVTVVDEQTGLSGSGPDYTTALEQLVERLRSSSEVASALEAIASADPETVQQLAQGSETATFIAHSKEVQQRFATEDVTPEDIDDAIEWARSE